MQHQLFLPQSTVRTGKEVSTCKHWHGSVADNTVHCADDAEHELVVQLQHELAELRSSLRCVVLSAWYVCCRAMAATSSAITPTHWVANSKLLGWIDFKSTDSEPPNFAAGLRSMLLYAEGNTVCAGVLCRLSLKRRALESRRKMWRRLFRDKPDRLLEVRPPCSG